MACMEEKLSNLVKNHSADKSKSAGKSLSLSKRSTVVNG